MFELQAARTPRCPAVISEDSTLTYAGLEAGANRLAHHLVNQGVGPDDLVAVAVPRSPQLLVAIYGVLKAGAAYLPIDPAYPDDWVTYVLADARPVHLLATASATPGTGLPVTVLDSPAVRAELARQPDHLPDRHLHPGRLAYVIYTSGSTGRPKGVAVSHRSVVDELRWLQECFALDADDRLLQQAPPSFDASVLDLFWPLQVGAAMVLPPPGLHHDPASLVELMRREHVTTVNLVPSMLALLLQEPAFARCDRLRRVLVGGEALPADVRTRFTNTFSVPLSNMYGPTETTVDATRYECPVETSPASASTPIGRPKANLRCHVLDDRLSPLPPLVTGELYLAGEGLARGYVNQPGLTAERFVACPIGGPGERMYRTGDLVRRRPDGDLEYVGRVDQQVKVRGFRIEPAEVERAVSEHAEVSQVAVVAREDRPGDRRLVAYLVPRAGHDIDPAALKRRMSSTVPEHMVPSAFVALDHLPLTPTGKLDRGSLPAPVQHRGPGGREPRTPHEMLLCGLFAELLGAERVTLDDDFFALGGHSLVAAQLVGRARQVLGIDITLPALFQRPTVAGLLGERDPAADGHLDVLVALRPHGDRPPLFCVHPALGLSWSYARLGRYLPGRPIYGLQPPGLTEPGRLPDDVERLAEEYLVKIRSVQPRGPYHLLGWSFGGLVAHSLALRLTEQGERVALLALLDSYPASPGAASDGSWDWPETVRLLTGLTDVEAVLRVERHSQQGRDELVELVGRHNPVLGSLAPAEIHALADATAHHIAIMRHFTPRAFDGEVLFFRATRIGPQRAASLERWSGFINGEMEVHDVDCEHDNMMDHAALERIGAVLHARLDG
jgi:amino acid adenylation domain-containing protein